MAAAAIASNNNEKSPIPLIFGPNFTHSSLGHTSLKFTLPPLGIGIQKPTRKK